MKANQFLLILAPLALPVAALAAPEGTPDASSIGSRATGASPADSPPGGAATVIADAPALELTLEQALERLDVQNLDVAVARVRAERASALTRIAQAALRPTLSATGRYVRNDDEVALNVGGLLSQIPGAPNVPNVVIQPLDAFTAEGTLRVPLFKPTAWHDVNTAEATEAVAAKGTELVRRQARAAIAQMAYGAVALEEVVAAAERAITLAGQQLESAQRRVQAGTATSLDVTRAETEKVRREGDLARAKADLDRVRLLMGVALGEAQKLRIRVPEAVAAPSPVSSVEAAYARRPEIAISEAEARVGEAMQSGADARFWPELNAMGTLFASDEPYPTGEHTGWRVAVELSVPLYDGGLRYGKRREAQSQLSLARTELLRKRLQIRREIADAEREIDVAAEQLRLAEIRVNLARDAAASAQRSFVVGLSTSLDVLDANDELFQAEVALAAEKAKRAQARVELQRALGAL